MEPLVSILIPAYNSEATIADTLRSAIAQTWQRKEIILIDDGSHDRTFEIARQFASGSVRVETQKNQGSSSARNRALQLSQGDYIQWLDHDDLLKADKIERQLRTTAKIEDRNLLLSSSWAPFYYRTRTAEFVRSSLCESLTPVEWLLRKMSENLHMQTSTWLVSRELTDAAGPWDTRLLSDDDGEYFCRVLIASKGTCFVPGTGVFWRMSGPRRLSFIGSSSEKRDALLVSMRLHLHYLQSLERSDRVRRACLAYLQTWFGAFYPERPDLVAEVQELAAQLGGKLEIPRLRRKYAWMRPIIGSKGARWAQDTLPQVKGACARRWDRTMYLLEGRESRNAESSPRLVSGANAAASRTLPASVSGSSHEPLVSIVIPAHNAERWIAQTIESALAQTWRRKEIIVVDDGSSDQTVAIARTFEARSVRVVVQKNSGAASARNHGFGLCSGDYIQWLDADDLLAPDKIERQLSALRPGDSRRILLSSLWGCFYYRPHRALFVNTSLCRDLSPFDWLFTKMRYNLHMQTATWLTSRELAEAAGPWDTRLLSDDDGEYFSRVLLASEGTRFVGGTGVYWRTNGFQRLSYIGGSDKKKEALLLSMKLHVQYLRSLEDSERVRDACLTYLQTWCPIFYPGRLDLVHELQALASELNGSIDAPRLSAKYAWMKYCVGWKGARWAQTALPQFKLSCRQEWDRAMYSLEARKTT